MSIDEQDRLSCLFETDPRVEMKDQLPMVRCGVANLVSRVSCHFVKIVAKAAN